MSPAAPERPEGPRLERSDLEALGAARVELGESYEAALLESFAERVEEVVRLQSAAAVARLRPAPRSAPASNGAQLALAILSLLAAVPISIVLGVTGNLTALLVAWAGIVAVNWAHAWHHRD